MRLQDNPYLPSDLPGLRRQLDNLYRQISTQLNQLSEGGINAVTNAATSPPASGIWTRGDFIRNAEPTEAGSNGARYVLVGWVCVASGEPGTWRQCRYLTGN